MASSADRDAADPEGAGQDVAGPGRDDRQRRVATGPTSRRPPRRDRAVAADDHDERRIDRRRQGGPGRPRATRTRSSPRRCRSDRSDRRRPTAARPDRGGPDRRIREARGLTRMSGRPAAVDPEVTAGPMPSPGHGPVSTRILPIPGRLRPADDPQVHTGTRTTRTSARLARLLELVSGYGPQPCRSRDPVPNRTSGSPGSPRRSVRPRASSHRRRAPSATSWQEGAPLRTRRTGRTSVHPGSPSLAAVLFSLAPSTPAAAYDADDRGASRSSGSPGPSCGDPYRYGAAGPCAFDCSGLVLYAYRARR